MSLELEVRIEDAVVEVAGVSADCTVDNEFLGLEAAGLEIELRDECEVSRLRLSRLGNPTESGCGMLRIFTACPLQPLDGMKIVVDPSLRFNEIRSGW